MKECIEMLALLGISVVSNTLCGVYLNVEKFNQSFDVKKLISGLEKAGCVCASSLGIAYVVDKMPDLSSAIGMEPKTMIVSAIAIYAGKTAVSLCKILGVTQAKQDEVSNSQNDESEFVDM